MSNVEVLGSGIVRFKTAGASLSDKVYICDLDSAWKGVGETICSAWLAQGQMALATSFQINVTYVTTAYNTCAELPINSLSIAPASVAVVKVL